MTAATVHRILPTAEFGDIREPGVRRVIDGGGITLAGNSTSSGRRRASTSRPGRS
jgi:hypothetical protein